MSVQLVGPITTYAVVLDGWVVPALTASAEPGGMIRLCLDQRITVDIPVADADPIVEFIADAIAIGLGYASHPRSESEPALRTPFARMMRDEHDTTDPAG